MLLLLRPSQWLQMVELLLLLLQPTQGECCA
jgi:hypothetical protein